MQGAMYPVSASAVVLRLVIHRLVRERTLHSGEVLSLGLFEGTNFGIFTSDISLTTHPCEGAVLYYALSESPTVGAGCFIGFGLSNVVLIFGPALTVYSLPGSRILLEHMKAPDPVSICCSFLGVAVGEFLLTLYLVLPTLLTPPPGILLSNVLEQLYAEIVALIKDPEEEAIVIVKPRPRSKRRVTFRSPVKRTSSRTQLRAPSVLESPSARRASISNPFLSPWESLQEPLDPRMGLENEVTELRRRASAAAGETRRLHEEKKWAHTQGNRTREFQLGLCVVS